MKQLIFVSIVFILLAFGVYAVFTAPIPVYAQTDNESSTSSSTEDYTAQVTSAVNMIITLILALIPALLVLKIIDKIFGGLFSKGGSFFFVKLRMYLVKAGDSLRAYMPYISYFSLAPFYFLLQTESSSVTIDLSFLYPLINIILLFAILGAIMKMMDRMAKGMGGK